VTTQDAGAWTCSLESYHNSQSRGYGDQGNATMSILIEERPENTTTTTATTTVFKVIPDGVSHAAQVYFDAAIGGEQNVPTLHADDGKPQASKDCGLARITILSFSAIWNVLTTVACIMFGLHNKRKLPAALYRAFGCKLPVQCNKKVTVHSMNPFRLKKSNKFISRGPIL
jgi:hypothetical protein